MIILLSNDSFFRLPVDDHQHVKKNLFKQITDQLKQREQTSALTGIALPFGVLPGDKVMQSNKKSSTRVGNTVPCC